MADVNSVNSLPDVVMQEIRSVGKSDYHIALRFTQLLEENLKRIPDNDPHILKSAINKRYAKNGIDTMCDQYAVESNANLEYHQYLKNCLQKNAETTLTQIQRQNNRANTDRAIQVVHKIGELASSNADNLDKLKDIIRDILYLYLDLYRMHTQEILRLSAASNAAIVKENAAREAAYAANTATSASHERSGANSRSRSSGISSSPRMREDLKVFTTDSQFHNNQSPSSPRILIVFAIVVILAAIIIPLIIYRHQIFGKPKKDTMSGGTIKLNKKRKIRLNKTKHI